LIFYFLVRSIACWVGIGAGEIAEGFGRSPEIPYELFRAMANRSVSWSGVDMCNDLCHWFLDSFYLKIDPQIWLLGNSFSVAVNKNRKFVLLVNKDWQIKKN